jgi:hypothetical protein
MKARFDRLPKKLLLQNVPNVQWLVKSDDEMFVRGGTLEKYLKPKQYWRDSLPFPSAEIWKMGRL